MTKPVSTSCASQTTQDLPADEFRENALQHLYRMERAQGVPPEEALRNMDEFARRLQEVEGRR